MTTNKPYRLTTYLDGRLLEEAFYDNWAQIGGKIGNLADDCDVIKVEKQRNLVLLYNVRGIY